ncbi:oxalate decarboxylase family bicupin [Rhodopila sp.]|uniref:oxalate decarboxylase family bicupin n=1 Tax=Rhodopila sp. TaxID=2480087 RepID=UPI003D0C485B
MDIPSQQQGSDPQPIRGDKGADDPGPRDVLRDRENKDVLAPPETDRGTIPNLKFSFADSHNRLEPGGWARQVTERELPVATTLAGVDMRLKAGAVRELHWHKEGEWSYMLYGSARITAVDEEGRQFVDDVQQGDLWFFPAGYPHSIQGLEPDGCEFLLVFDSGGFSEDSTFLISDWFAHTPKSVLAKNFGWPESALAAIPKQELYIFPTEVPGPIDGNRIGPRARQSFSYRLLAQAPQRTSGGTVRIVDSRNFPASRTVAAAFVEVEPGGLRELHWHPQADEWQYYIDGEARMTVFASEGKARTFDYRAGDVGYVPHAMGHYIENTGSTTLRFLEMFRSDRFADISLKQWMALTPHELVQAHLHIDRRLLDALPQEKLPVMHGNTKDGT